MNVTLDEKKQRAATLSESRLVISLRHRHLSRVVNGADALLALEPRLGEFFTRDFLDDQFRRLVNDITVFLSSNLEARSLYTTCDLHRVARQHADKLLSAARLRRSEWGI